MRDGSLTPEGRADVRASINSNAGATPAARLTPSDVLAECSDVHEQDGGEAHCQPTPLECRPSSLLCELCGPFACRAWVSPSHASRQASLLALGANCRRRCPNHNPCNTLAVAV